MRPINLDPNVDYLSSAQKLDIPEWRKSIGAFEKETAAFGRGFQALGAHALGMEETRDEALEAYERNMAEAQSGWRAPEVGRFEDIEGVGDFGKWAGFQLPKGIGQLLVMGAGGGVGGALAKGATLAGTKLLAKRSMATVATKLAAKNAGKTLTAAQVQTRGLLPAAQRAAEELVQQQVRRNIALGVTGGAAGASFGIEGGSIFGELATDPKVGPEAALGPAVVGGAASVLLDVLPGMVGAEALGVRNWIKTGIRKAIKKNPELAKKAKQLHTRIAQGAAAGIALEGPTEGLQELVHIAAERWAKDDPMFAKLDAEQQSAVLNSVAAGALIGGVAGAAAGPFTAPQAPEVQDGLQVQREGGEAEGVVEPTPEDQGVESRGETTEEPTRAEEATVEEPATDFGVQVRQQPDGQWEVVAPDVVVSVNVPTEEEAREIADQEIEERAARGEVAPPTVAPQEAPQTIEEPIVAPTIEEPVVAPEVPRAEQDTQASQVYENVPGAEPVPGQEVPVSTKEGEQGVRQKGQEEALVDEYSSLMEDARSALWLATEQGDNLAVRRINKLLKNLQEEFASTTNIGELDNEKLKKLRGDLEFAIGDRADEGIARVVMEEARRKKYTNKEIPELPEGFVLNREFPNGWRISWSDDPRDNLVEDTKEQAIQLAQDISKDQEAGDPKDVKQGQEEVVETLRKRDGTTFDSAESAQRELTRRWNNGKLQIEKGKEAGRQARARVAQEGDGWVIQKLESRTPLFSKPTIPTTYVSPIDFIADSDRVLGQGWTQRAIDAGLLKLNETSAADAPSATYNKATGAVEVNLDKVPADQGVAGVVAHDLGSHAGMAQMLGQEVFDDFVNDLRKLADAGSTTAREAMKDSVRGLLVVAPADSELGKIRQQLTTPGLTTKQESDLLTEARDILQETQAWALAEEDMAYYVQRATSETPKEVGFWNRLRRALEAWFAGTRLGQGLTGLGWRPEMSPELAVSLARAGARNITRQAEAAQKLRAQQEQKLKELPAGWRQAVLESAVWHVGPQQWAPESGFPRGRPRLDKVGTGEGGQLFGWGWYSAENPAVSGPEGSYAKTFGAQAARRPAYIPILVNGKEIGPNPDSSSEQAAASWWESDFGQDIDSAIATAKTNRVKEILTKWKKQGAQLGEVKPATAAVYHLNIPDEDVSRMLLWEKPLSEQTEGVRGALEKIKFIEPHPKGLTDSSGGMGYVIKGTNKGITNAAELYAELEPLLRRKYTQAELEQLNDEFFDANPDANGYDFDRWLKAKEGHPKKKVSEYLRSLGIVGNKYLDQGSRKPTESPTFNYVIWDQDVLDQVAHLNPETGTVLESRFEIPTRTGLSAIIELDASPRTIKRVLAREAARARRDGDQFFEGVRILKDPRDGSLHAWPAEANLLHKDVAVKLGIDPSLYNIVPVSGQAVTEQQVDEVLAEMPEEMTGLRKEFSVGEQVARRTEMEPLVLESRIWRSGVEDAVEASPQAKMAPAQWKGWTKKQAGVKQEELQDLEFEDWLDAQEGAVTKEAVLWFVRDGGVRIEETQLKQYRSTEQMYGPYDDEAKFSDYQLPGGENYRELLVTIPSETKADWLSKQEQKLRDTGLSEQEYAEFQGVQAGLPAPARPDYVSSHFSEPNILVHLRFNERTDAAGKRVLFVEEVQSDWHQEGRKEGYAKPDTRTEAERQEWLILETLPEKVRTTEQQNRLEVLDAKRVQGGVPDAPFKSSWPLLGMKRAVRWAAENGFDSVAWTPGEVQAERYDLSKQVGKVEYSEPVLGAYDLDGRLIISQESVSREKLQDYIGKEAAEKLLQQPEINSTKTLEGTDLRVGGEGMRAFYDKMLPSMLNKYGKKFGARVGTTEIPTLTQDGFATEGASREVWSLPITERLRDEALAGQLLYSFPRVRDMGKSETWFTNPVSTAVASRNRPGYVNELFHNLVDAFHYAKAWSPRAYRAMDEHRNIMGAAHELVKREYFQPMLRLVRRWSPSEGELEPFRRMGVEEPAAEDLAGHQLAARHVVLDGKVEGMENVNEYLALKMAPRVLKELKPLLSKSQQTRLNAEIEALLGKSKELPRGQAQHLLMKYSQEQLDPKAQELITDWLLVRRRGSGYSTAVDPEAKAVDEKAGFLNAHEVFAAAQQNPLFDELGSLSDRLARYQLETLRGEEGRGILQQKDVDALWGAYQHHVPLRREDFDYDLAMQEALENPRRGMGRLMKRVGSTGHPSAANVIQNHLAAGYGAGTASARNEMFNKLADIIYADKEGWQDKLVIHSKRRHKTDVAFERKGKTLFLSPNDKNLRAVGLMRALSKMDSEQLKGPMKLMRSLNNWIRWTAVSANPALVVANTPRDYLTAKYNLKASEAGDYSKEISSWSAYKKAFKALHQVMVKDDRTETGDAQHDANIELVEDYEQHGGKTSFVQTLRPQDSQSWRSFANQVRKAHGKKRAVVEWGEKALRSIEDLNITIENVMRLSTYKVMREKFQTDQGMTETEAKSKAAELARNLTTNFTRRGAHIDTINTWWLFYNATVQGNWQVIQNLFFNENKKGAKRLAKAVGGTVLFSFMLDQLGRASDDEWDEIPEWEKDRKIITPLTVMGDHFSIPAPWMFNIFWRAGSLLSEVTDGVKKPDDALMDLIGLVTSSMDPIGGGKALAGEGTWLQAAAPTSFDWFVQINENRNWMGNPLGPEGFATNNRPDAYVAWDSTPEGYKHAAQFVNELTGGNVVESGLVDLRPSTYRVLAEFLMGGIGRFGVDLAQTTGLMSGKNVFEREGPADVPGVKAFFAGPTNQTAVSLYHDRVAKVLSAERLTKEYADGPNRDPLKLAEVQRDRATQLRMTDYVKDVERQIKALRKSVKSAVARDDSRTEKMLRDRIVQLQRRFNESYAKRVGN